MVPSHQALLYTLYLPSYPFLHSTAVFVFPESLEWTPHHTTYPHSVHHCSTSTRADCAMRFLYCQRLCYDVVQHVLSLSDPFFCLLFLLLVFVHAVFPSPFAIAGLEVQRAFERCAKYAAHVLSCVHHAFC